MKRSETPTRCCGGRSRCGDDGDRSAASRFLTIRQQRSRRQNERLNECLTLVASLGRSVALLLFRRRKLLIALPASRVPTLRQGAGSTEAGSAFLGPSCKVSQSANSQMNLKGNEWLHCGPRPPPSLPLLLLHLCFDSVRPQTREFVCGLQSSPPPPPRQAEATGSVRNSAPLSAAFFLIHFIYGDERKNWFQAAGKAHY